MNPTYPQLKNEALTLITAIRETAKQLGQTDLDRLNEGAEILQNGKLYVVVCGEFKRGKSSLINALLEVPDLCPVDIDIATSVVIFIEWQAKEEIIVITGDLGREQQTRIKREQIKEYVTEQHNKNNQKRVRQLIIRGPFQQLKDGLVIIDTPGLGGLNSEHGAMTYDVLPKAQVALFVMHVSQPLTQRELSFVKDWLNRYCKRTLYVVTGIDQLCDYKNYVNDARIKLAATLETKEEELTVLPVSNLLKLDYLKTKDPDDLTESRYQDLEDAIWMRLNAEAAFILIASAIESIIWSLAVMREPLEAQAMYFDQQQRDEILQREEKIKDIRNRLNQLQDESIDWVSDAHRDFQIVEMGIISQVTQAFQDIQLSILNDIRDGGKYEVIRDSLRAQTIHAGYELDKLLDDQTAEVYIEFRNKLTVNLDEIFPAQITINLPTIPNIKTPSQEMGTFQRYSKYGLKTMKAYAKKFISTKIPLGDVFFPTAQSMYEYERQHAQLHGIPTREDMNQYAQHFINKSRDSIQGELRKKLLMIRDSVIKELRTKIRQERDRCNKILTELQAAKAVTEQQIKPKLDQVRAQLKQLATLETTAARLCEKIENQRVTAETESQPVTHPQPSKKSDNYGDFADA